MSTEGFILGDSFKVRFISSDSMGTRSMATVVEAGSLRVFIDPSVSLGPKRYGLPPHPLEVSALVKSWEKIEKELSESHVVVITHYHYDHHNPERAALLKGKRVFLKNPHAFINRSQRERAARFMEALKRCGCIFEVVEGEGSVDISGVKISFSPPLTHGPTKKLGYVMAVSISFSGKKFLFSSDIQGPCTRDQLDYILGEDPDLLYLDGPVTYLLGYAYSKENLERSLDGIKKILEESKVSHIVVDHHTLRDKSYKERLRPVIFLSERLGKRIITASQAMGRENLMLEAYRRELYKGSFPVLDNAEEL